MAVTTNLYPPIVNDIQPSFVKTNTCKIYFSLSSFNSLEGMILTSPNYCPIYIKQEDGIEYTPAPPNGSNGKRIHHFKTRGSLFAFTSKDTEDIDDLFL